MILNEHKSYQFCHGRAADLASPLGKIVQPKLKGACRMQFSLYGSFDLRSTSALRGDTMSAARPSQNWYLLCSLKILPV